MRLWLLCAVAVAVAGVAGAEHGGSGMAARGREVGLWGKPGITGMPELARPWLCGQLPVPPPAPRGCPGTEPGKIPG